MEDVFIDVADEPQVVKLKVKPKPQLPISRCEKIVIGLSCSSITAVILYYFILFIIECAKNSYITS